jgi:Glycosyl transferase family 2
MSLSVTAIIAAYNEADVIGQVIEDLIGQGVSVYLLDHGSTDGTANEAAVWLGRGLLAIERFPEESGFPAELANCFALEQQLARKEQLARELEADWFLHADADELREGPLPNRTLAESIEDVDRLGYNAIDFAVLNFPPTHDNFRTGDALRSSFTYFEKAEEFDRVQVKCWKKTPDIDLRSTAGHEALFSGRRIFPIRFLDLHYPIRTQAQGKRKVFVERQPRFRLEERERGWHVQYDSIAAGHSFVRDPDDLTPFDPVLVRLALLERHRGMEELSAALEVERREGTTATMSLAELTNEHQLLIEELERTRNELANEGERLRRALHSADAERSEAHAELDRTNAEHQQLIDLIRKATYTTGALLESRWLRVLDILERPIRRLRPGLGTVRSRVSRLRDYLHVDDTD